jgi:hypothetical protein
MNVSLCNYNLLGTILRLEHINHACAKNLMAHMPIFVFLYGSSLHPYIEMWHLKDNKP